MARRATMNFQLRGRHDAHHGRLKKAPCPGFRSRAARRPSLGLEAVVEAEWGAGRRAGVRLGRWKPLRSGRRERGSRQRVRGGLHRSVAGGDAEIRGGEACQSWIQILAGQGAPGARAGGRARGGPHVERRKRRRTGSWDLAENLDSVLRPSNTCSPSPWAILGAAARRVPWR